MLGLIFGIALSAQPMPPYVARCLRGNRHWDSSYAVRLEHCQWAYNLICTHNVHTPICTHNVPTRRAVRP
jgi:hypothetical protein